MIIFIAYLAFPHDIPVNVFSKVVITCNIPKFKRVNRHKMAATHFRKNQFNSQKRIIFCRHPKLRCDKVIETENTDSNKWERAGRQTKSVGKNMVAKKYVGVD